MAIHGADVVADPALEGPAGYHPSERPTARKRRRAAEGGPREEEGEEGEEEDDDDDDEEEGEVEGCEGREGGEGGGDLSAAAAGRVWPAQVTCCLGYTYHGYTYHGYTKGP